MFEDGKPRSSDRRTVTERHADTAYIDTHNNTLFRAWCRAVGLSEGEITRIVSETVMSPSKPPRARGGVRTR